MFKRELQTALPFPLEWQDFYILTSLPRYLGKLSKPDVLWAQSRILEIVATDKQHICDRQSQGHLLICAAVHAYYEILLLAGTSKRSAVEKLTFALMQPGSKTTKLIMWLTLKLCRDKRQMIENETRRKTQTLYGKSFEFEEEVDETSFVSIVTKCAYFSYFKRHGLPHLTAIFCAWDAVWIDPIKGD
ncbi:L-2-amino-thiazoline-4-carboxylic acid hydrolase [uncultured Maritalea sp.]|jgi:hypothetical protein|uniref:L-2-amino-thiazoline-4-carboxylic acid hydrolase n=1 Tax=uncultured Maritalea sp. TaxID=757249 RepID=UPI00260E099A|nr:L-2-amino-thiazoline-4-carboxylic acid hydrolase [uncultured Maritalea sp.]